LEGKLQFNNLSFKYPSREAHVLSQLSFTLMPGQSLGICGSTGSDKSTIAILILRMYDPQSGEVLADDVDIKSLNVRSLRSQLGWVPQKPVLFEGDLRFNMKIGRIDATN
jgi:ABC-type multidrug transport system fused ATPase/permease subunit